MSTQKHNVPFPDFPPDSRGRYFYVETKGEKSYQRIFRDLAKCIPVANFTKGGTIWATTAHLQLPDGSCFYAIRYSGDFVRWRKLLVQACVDLGIRWGELDGKQFRIMDGSIYALSECIGEIWWYEWDEQTQQRVKASRRITDWEKE